VVLVLDKKPNIQALERSAPKQLMRPGQIERQEFEYVRHATVNWLVVLNVYSGKMQGGVWTRTIVNISAAFCRNYWRHFASCGACI